MARTIGYVVGAATILMAGMTAANAAPAAQAAQAMILDTATDRLNRMTIDVFVNGEGPFPFTVDTGAERSVISEGLARKLGIIPDGTARLHSVAGVDKVVTARIETLRIGARRIENVQAPVLPDASLGAAGLIGIDALADQQVVMNFVDGQLSIRPGATREPQDRDTIVVTARRKFGRLVLVDAFVGDERVFAIVDSGAQTTVGNLALKRLMSKRKPTEERPTEIIGVTGRTIAGNHGVLPEMKIGAVRIGNMHVVYSDAHPFKKLGLTHRPAMLLGTDLLRAFERVSLDFGTKKVRFLLRSEQSDAGEIRLASASSD